MASEDKWFQTKRSIHVKNEYEKWNYLKTGLQPGQGFEVDGAGDCDRFKHGSGFTRRIGEPCADSRNALNNHFETRRATHDAKRHDHLHQTINRNGFDPIAHQQQSQRDDFAPRGPRWVDDVGGEVRRVEVAIRERDTQFRFFRVEDHAASPRMQHRAAVLLDAGLQNAAAKRCSSVIGFGRRDIPSTGASDAFSAADYGGMTRPEQWLKNHPHQDRTWRSAGQQQQQQDGAQAVHANHNGGDDADNNGMRTDVPFFLQEGPRTVWDVGRIDPMSLRRREAATARAPNRVFDATSVPVVLPAIADPVHRALRENEEIIRNRPARPIDRPASFTAHATMLATQRMRSRHQDEVNLVRSLRSP